MKRIIIVVVVVLISLLLVGNISYSRMNNNIDENLLNTYSKEELYQIIVDKRINYRDKDLVYILTHWYNYFDKEEMFLTQDGEYVDFVTYEIYRVHLENDYKNDNKKVLKQMLKFNNFPKQENSEKYDKYINEYKKTTGKDI